MAPRYSLRLLEKALEDLIAARNKQARELEIALESGQAVHDKLKAILAMVKVPECREALKNCNQDYVRRLIKDAKLDTDSEISPPVS